MDDRMERRAPWIPWAITSLLLVAVAIGAYLLGTHDHVAVAGDSVEHARHHYHAFHGFGFWWIFILFWIFGGMRGLWWGGYYGHPWRYRRYPPRWYVDDRDEWEAWHRREHERMDSSGRREPSSSDPGRQP